MDATPLVQIGLEPMMSGLFPGANPDSIPLWITAQDVVFDGAAVRLAPGLRLPVGQSGYFDSAAGMWDAASGLWDAASTSGTLTPTGTLMPKGVHQQIQSDGSRLIVWGDAKKLYAFNGSTTSDVTRTSGDYTAPTIGKPGYWSFEQWGNWIIATNGIDAPQVWKVGSVAQFAALANFPADSAEIVRRLGPHLVFFNLTGTYTPTSTPALPNQFVWSKKDDIEAWNPATTGNETAGELTLRDLSGRITAVERLGDNLLAYGQLGVHILFPDAVFMIGQQKGATNAKALEKNSIASVSSTHYMVNESGIFVTDGITLTPVAFPKFGDYLRRAVDWTKPEQIVTCVLAKQNTIVWKLPTTTSSIQLAFNYLNQTIAWWNQGFECACPEVAQFGSLVGLIGGAIKEYSPFVSTNTAELITKPLAPGNRNLEAFVDCLTLYQDKAFIQTYYRSGHTQSECEAAMWLELGTSTTVETMLYVMQESVYFQFKFLMSATTDGAAFSGFDLYGKSTGRRL